MSSRREVQVSQIIAQLAGEFIERESTVHSLITVTHAEMSPDMKQVTVFLSVLPQTQEEEALAFAKRARSDFRTYIREHSFLHPIPFVDFELDYGEKNRQRIDELTR